MTLNSDPPQPFDTELRCTVWNNAAIQERAFQQDTWPTVWNSFDFLTSPCPDSLFRAIRDRGHARLGGNFQAGD